MLRYLLLVTSFFYLPVSVAAEKLEFFNQNISLQSKNPKFSEEVNYPQIRNPKNTAEKKLNALIKQRVLESISEFKKSVYENEGYALPKELKENGSSFSIKYDLSTIEPRRFVSLRLSQDTFIAGSAHPSHVYTAINYDLNSNQIVSIADLFKNKVQGLNYLATIATKRVMQKIQKDSDGQGSIFKEGLTPKESNFEVWNLKQNGLQFTFNEYQVAAYVFGPQIIHLSSKELKPYLKTGTAIDTCFSELNCQIYSSARD